MTDPTHYHSPQHWNRVHAESTPASGGRAIRALHASVSGAIDARLCGGGRLLELACGSAALLRGLRSDCLRVGADFSSRALHGARRQQGSEGCVWVQADAARLPLATQAIDVAVCMSSLWVFPDPRRCLLEWSRVMKRDGTLVVHLWGPPAQCRLITLGAASVAKVLQTERPAHVTGPFDLTVEGVVPWLRDAGFESLEWRRFDHTCPVEDTQSYWTEFADLAQTAHADFCAASSGAKSKINSLLEKLLMQSRKQSGGTALSVSWWLGVARFAAL